MLSAFASTSMADLERLSRARAQAAARPRALNARALSSGRSDPLIRSHLGLLALSSEGLLSRLSKVVPTVAASDDGDVGLLVLVRTARIMLTAQQYERAIRSVLLLLLAHEQPPSLALCLAHRRGFKHSYQTNSAHDHEANRPAHSVEACPCQKIP